MSSNGKVILYASYQTGENLPGYVQFALKHLAETDFTVVLLTNNRPLSAETMKFLDDNGYPAFKLVIDPDVVYEDSPDKKVKKYA